MAESKNEAIFKQKSSSWPKLLTTFTIFFEDDGRHSHSHCEKAQDKNICVSATRKQSRHSKIYDVHVVIILPNSIQECLVAIAPEKKHKKDRKKRNDQKNSPAYTGRAR